MEAPRQREKLVLTGLGGRVAVVRAEATSTKSGILLGARGMRFVDRERALMRLRNVAEMEEWTEEQYLAACSDIGAGTGRTILSTGARAGELHRGWCARGRSSGARPECGRRCVLRP